MENQKITYNQIIELLQEKQYSAPNQWENIASDLTLADNYSQLSEYKAPDHLWDKIENELDESLPSLDGQHSPNRMRYILLGLFVSILLTLAIVFLPTEKDEFIYTSEVEYNEMELPSVDNYPTTYKEGKTFIEENKSLFESESLDNYQEQIDEIEKAIKMIKEMQNQYGEDTSSIRQLSKLERKKSQLLKSLINRA